MKGTRIPQSGTAEPSDQNNPLKYSRIILKLSGEVFKAEENIFEPRMIDYLVDQITECRHLGICIGIVIGGGNIVRGRDMKWLNKVDADMCGIMATIINGMVLFSKMREKNLDVRLVSGCAIPGVVSRANAFEDIAYYNRGTVIIFAGGTGNPLFTTDTAAALRAVEYRAHVLIKGTKVEGVYSADPVHDASAQFYKHLRYDQAITENLNIMDLAAFVICRDAGIPICVYDFCKYPLSQVIQSGTIGTLVSAGGKDDQEN
jgi:uridylate kinase